ncbi:unnamed protein product [Calicophoron daubneyi]|uniref:Leucine-rich repeat-containing protein 40 n=1 Tax=Calicophoron daubneyi TaxID=300641 RepID=A0AAV2TLE3_CALDB
MMTFDFSSKKKGPAKGTEEINIKILRQAQQSGALNLANRSLTKIPEKIWDLNNPLPPEGGAGAVDMSGESTECRWWETQPISRLVLTSNRLTSLSGDGLAKLDTLTYLDVRDNQLVELPEEVRRLINLRSLIASANKLRILSNGLWNLGGLALLDLSNNQIERLGDNLSHLVSLERMDVSNNQLVHMPQRWPSGLRQLDVSHNRLERFPDGFMEELPNLQSVDLSHNVLHTLTLDRRPPADRSDSQLAIFQASFNQMTAIPDLRGFIQLKEVCISDNRIQSVSYDSFQDCPLATLDLGRNKIAQLPEGISVTLPNLVRLDVSSNDLNGLPTELGLMSSLQVLLVERNPLKSIRQTVVMGGTNALKALLRQRHVPAEKQTNAHNAVQIPRTNPNPTRAQPSPASDMGDRATNGNVRVAPTVVQKDAPPASVPKVPTVAQNAAPTASVSKANYSVPCVTLSGILDWNANSKTNATPPLPPLDSESDWLAAAALPHTVPSAASPPPVKQLQLENRMLSAVPKGLYAFATTLTTLCLASNKISQLPDDIDRLGLLTHLDVSHNLLRTLPISLSRLSSLTNIRLDKNPLGPEVPTEALFIDPLAHSLEYLSLRGCQLAHTPPPQLLQPSVMPNLAHLDISDNNISTLPPELGLCTQLKSLQVCGNTFRIPRPAVVAKGTPAVLEYLRSRIPAKD